MVQGFKGSKFRVRGLRRRHGALAGFKPLASRFRLFGRRTRIAIETVVAAGVEVVGADVYRHAAFAPGPDALSGVAP
jgi:hypothetical protein